MSVFKIKIDTEALQDIEEATIWYNEQVKGVRFQVSKASKGTDQFIKEKPFGQCYPLCKCALFTHQEIPFHDTLYH